MHIGAGNCKEEEKTSTVQGGTLPACIIWLFAKFSQTNTNEIFSIRARRYRYSYHQYYSSPRHMLVMMKLFEFLVLLMFKPLHLFPAVLLNSMWKLKRANLAAYRQH